MRLDDIIAGIEACGSVAELRQHLDAAAQSYGFSGFGFIDAGRIGRGELPFYVGATQRSWEEDYTRYNFVNVDPCLRQVRRTNRPFTWSSIATPLSTSRRQPGAVRIMEAAHDHGFRDGLVIPFHFRDAEGLLHSTSAVFYWKNQVDRFNRLLRSKKNELYLILIYWAQRVLDLRRREDRGRPLSGFEPSPENHLTDREKDVLAWAAAGLTVASTAEKLNLSADTVDTHMRNAIRKLGANNKTHATAIALHLGLIDF